MGTFVGLDVSLKATSICVLDEAGARVFEGKAATDPAVLARLIRKRAPEVARVGLESGPTSAWLFRALTAAGVPAVCLDARHAQAALSVRPNKSDPSDARGLAEMVRMGWFRTVNVKSATSHERKALLISRHQFVEIRVRTDNQLRGILKTFGLIIGTCGRGHISRRARELVADRPELESVVHTMLAVRETVVAQIAQLDRMIRQLAKEDDTIRRMMTVPGVGPVVALAFQSVVDDPGRFGRATDVGAYLGLTPKRYQSGELDLAGRISKCGDAFLRGCLYEAAGVLLTKVQRWSPLKAWGTRLMKRVGAKKAKVALARKLAIVLFRIWKDGTEFRWEREAAMA